MFNLEVGEAPNKNNEKKEEVNPNKLEDMIKELGTTLITVKHEQEYMQVTYKINCVIYMQLCLITNHTSSFLLARSCVPKDVCTILVF